MTAANEKDVMDVVDVLTEQHRRISKLFERLETSRGTQKQKLFDELVRLLTAHESAEEEILHPVARMHVDNGDALVNSRLQEERETKRALAELCALGVSHVEFGIKLRELAETVDRHATKEEREEFEALRRNLPRERLQRMAGAVRGAERTAPPRPHLVTGESAAAQVLIGTPIGLVDRAWDTIRQWREHSASR